MGAEELGHALGILAVLWHAQMQGLQTEIEQETVLRRRCRTEVTHELCHEFGDVAQLAEGLDIGESVVGVVGCAEVGELLGMGHPVEVSAIDHGTAHLGGHAVHVLRGGVGDNVGTPFERTAVDGRGEGVVDDEGHAVLMGNACKAFDVEDGTARVGDGFAEDQFCVWLEGCLDFFVRGFGRDEGAVDAQFLHGHTEQVVRASIDFVGGDEVVAGLADVEHGVEVGGLSATRQHGTHTTFESGNLGCHGVVGGVLQTGVEVAVFLQVKQFCHLVRVVVLERRALDDGQFDRFSVLGLVTCLHAE